jgi:hypothetical protein
MAEADRTPDLFSDLQEEVEELVGEYPELASASEAN